MIQNYKNNLPMLAQYLALNGIVDLFVFKEGERRWQVYAGDAAKMQGVKQGGFFSTKREATVYIEECNELISRAKTS